MPRPFYQSTLKLTQASLAALLLVAMSGCTSRSEDGDVITITFALWCQFQSFSDRLPQRSAAMSFVKLGMAGALPSLPLSLEYYLDLECS